MTGWPPQGASALARDTIVAVATPPGTGAIGVVRLSGPQALRIAKEIFRPFSGTPPPDSRRIRRRAMSYGRIADPECGATLDQGLLLTMPGPRSFTGEDVAELHCHGGELLVHKVLTICIRLGARPATRGEFTRRAYLNGRIDLIQAEAVANLVRAETEQGLLLAARQLEGGLGQELGGLLRRLGGVAAAIEATIDFPDDECEAPDEQWMRAEFAALKRALQGLLATADSGRRMGDGVSAVIAGRPNVGKSSIFNRLLGRRRAIVDEQPGTTRDVVEARLDLGGMPVRLMDTAGLREPGEHVEEQGMAMAAGAIDTGDLLLLVVEASPLPGPDDRRALAGAGRRLPCLVVVNKIDVEPAPVDADAIRAALDLGPDAPLVAVSALTGAGWSGLESRLADLTGGPALLARDAAVLTTARQERAVREALVGLESARAAHEAAMPFDVWLVGMYLAMDSLAHAIGRRPDEVREQVLEEVFARFCVGK